MTDPMPDIYDGEWWTYSSAVLELALWLEDRGEVKTAGDVIALLEKPWRWSREFGNMMQARVAAA